MIETRPMTKEAMDRAVKATVPFRKHRLRITRGQRRTILRRLRPDAE